MNRSSWAAERARLNHDWLIVSFMTFLLAWRDDLDSFDTSKEMRDEIRFHFKDWQLHHKQLRNLISRAQQVLGPLGQFDSDQLNPDDKSLKQFIESAHASWMESSNISKRVTDLTNAVESANSIIEGYFNGSATVSGGTELYKLCLLISRGLSGLPSV